MSEMGWLGLGLHAPAETKGCDQGCEPAAVAAVDIYCERHGRFLLLAET